VEIRGGITPVISTCRRTGEGSLFTKMIRPVRFLHGAVLAAVLIFTAVISSAQVGPDPFPGPPRLLQFRLELHRLLPSTLTIEEGKYLLRISKGVILSDVEFRLQDAGQRVQAQGVAKGKGELTHIPVVLRPGQYALSVPGVPEWKCDVTVTPRR